MATSTIKQPISPKNYGTAEDITDSSNWKAPSDGIIIISYGNNDTGYCYINIGSSPQMFTSRSSGDGFGRSWVFPIFTGQIVSLYRNSGTVKFWPYTY